MRRTAIAFVAALATAPGGLAAQSAGHGPAVVELPAGARAAGLGGAYQLGSPDSDVLFHHPALLTRAAGMMMGWSTFDGTSTSLTASAATDWWGGGVGIGVRMLEYSSSAAPHARPGGVDPLVRGGSTGGSEYVATVGYARSVGPLLAGAAAKLVGQRWGAEREPSGALDAGVAVDLGRLWVGLSVRDLGPDAELAGADVTPPASVGLGAGGYGLPVGPLDVGVAARVARRSDGEVLAGGGVEVGYWPVVGRTFVLRLGATTVPEGDASPLTIGGSYWGDDLVLEYAFQPFDDSDGIHRLSVGWR